MPQLVSQLFTWQTENDKEKIMAPCENNMQSITI